MILKSLHKFQIKMQNIKLHYQNESLDMREMLRFPFHIYIYEIIFFTTWLVLPNFLFNVYLFHYLLNVFVDRSLFFLVTFCLIKDSSKKYGSDLLMIYKHV